MRTISEMLDVVSGLGRRLWLILATSCLLMLCVMLFNQSKPIFTLRHIYVKPQSGVEQGWLAEQLESYLSNDLLSLPLPVISSKLHSNPWVKMVKLRRQLPNTLTVVLALHEPIVKWNNQGYLTEDGHLVEVTQTSQWDHLPLLEGPNDQMKQVWQKYEHCQQIVDQVGLALSGLVLTPWGSWRLIMNGQIEVVMGKKNSDERLRRFVLAYQSMPSLQEVNHPVYVDLRYSNGVAIDWQSQLKQEKG